eukprot:CAMPEP_0194196802 /NCGR_PEP_ID=MMETSP0154-20130528/76864_1 /TAXON_ID=1049557 /ORGANISM="Thalassiothrix antarctica, Strain L6-D1" /LENGTH=586 /DNA_ID=CAMNT_0038921431 /DNA_START=288 /DNA_END=2048 /DNA_ORIENTATION=+
MLLTVGHCIGEFNEVVLGKQDYLNYYDTNYESFLLEDESIHPRYYKNSERDNDPYEMAIVKLYGYSDLTPARVNRNSSVPMKLYGYSDLTPARVNRNSSVPSVAGTSLLIMGFGVTDPEILNEASDVLKKGYVKYIPNDVCKDISAFVEESNTTLSMNNRIVDVNLCAADFEDGGQDICSGDSGGPILLPSSDKDEPLTVLGVTSGSYFCASDTFPAIYVRTSETIDWITEQVCSKSYYPPDDFNCEPVAEEEEEDTMISVTLEIRFLEDFLKPEEIGWMLVGNNKKYYGYEGIFSYTVEDIQWQNTTTTTTPYLYERNMMIPDNRQYTFQQFTRRGGGTIRGIKLFSEDRVYFEVQKNTGRDYSVQTVVENFTVGTVLTTAPSVSSNPTSSSMPSTTPTSLSERRDPYFTIDIVFDKYSEETGWSLEGVTSEDDVVLMDIQYAGSYKEYKNQTVTEYVDVLPKVYDYKFIMFDNEGDGLCCDYGDGSVSVYYTDMTIDRELLFRITEFYLEDVHEITIPNNNDNGEITLPVVSKKKGKKNSTTAKKEYNTAAAKKEYNTKKKNSEKHFASSKGAKKKTTEKGNAV